MNTPVHGKSATRQQRSNKAQRQVFRPVTDSALTLKWPTLPANELEWIVTEMKRLLCPVGEYRRVKRRNLQRRHKDPQAEAEECTVVDTSAVVVGYAAVTRLLRRDPCPLQMVLVCKEDAKALVVHAQLLLQIAMAKGDVRAVGLPLGTELRLTEWLFMNRVTMLGVRSSDAWTPLIARVQQLVPPLQTPFQHFVPTTIKTVQTTK